MQGFDGSREGDLAFGHEALNFLVPNVLGSDRFPSGHVAADAENALSFVLSGSDAREYYPLEEHPALFREFAFINPSDDAFVKFANRWGALGSEGTCAIIRVSDDGSELDEYPRIWGEIPELWKIESGNMHDAVALWDAVRLGNNDVLEKSIWIEDDTVNWHSVPSGWAFSGADWVSAPEHHPERLQPIKRYGLPRAAKYIVQDLVNEGLRGRVREQFEWEDAGNNRSVQIVPTNLVGALWLQLANAINSNLDFKQCAECSIWFEIAPGSGRPDKHYCSNACRMRAYRTRKKEKS